MIIGELAVDDDIFPPVIMDEELYLVLLKRIGDGIELFRRLLYLVERLELVLPEAGAGAVKPENAGPVDGILNVRQLPHPRSVAR